MNNKIQLSVVIPAYNESDYLPDILNDLKNQTYQNFEIIVADSESEDDTFNKALKLQKQIPNLQVILSRRGVSQARNDGAGLSKGEFILFIDADSRIEENFLEKLMKCQEHSNADFMTCNFKASGYHPIDKIYYWILNKGFYLRSKLNKPLASGTAMFVRSTIHRDMDGFDEKMEVAEDLDYFKRISNRDYNFHFCKKAKITTSNRRFKKDGRFRMIARQIAWSLDLKYKFSQEYEFGHYRDERNGNKLISAAKFTAVTLIILLAIMYLMGLFYVKKNNITPTSYGVSFSLKETESLGVDWQDNLRFLTEDMGFKKLRLMSYWDMHEQSRNNYDFQALDSQLDIAEQNDAKVSLAVGMRQPRWPECHIPSWARNLKTEEFNNELLEYLEIVVNRYKYHPAIESYQLENEAANRLFGDCPELNRELIINEFQLIKKLDPSKPLIINASNQSGIPIRQPVGDKIGLSVYKKSNIMTPWGSEHYWSFWYIPAKWHSFKAQLIDSINGDGTAFIHELQNEPWGDKPTSQLTITEQRETMNPDKIQETIDFAQRIGANEIYLWGGEWWYWRKVKYDDDTIYTSVLQSIN